MKRNENDEKDCQKREGALRQMLSGNPFLATCSIAHNGMTITTSDCLVDTGAGGEAFASLPFAD